MTSKSSPKKIALLIQGSRSYERGLLRGIADYSNQFGPWQFYRQVPPISGGEQVSVEHILHWRPDAMIIRESPFSNTFLDLPIPTIFSPATELRAGISNIYVDDHAVGRMAARHLYECGLRRFAYCGLDDLFFWSKRRGDAFSQTVREYGLPVKRYDRPRGSESLNWNRDVPLLCQWLSDLPTPIGLMVCNDDFSLFVLEACKVAKRRVPEEIAIIGVGNDEAVCELTTTPLSSIELNTIRAGYECAAHLSEILDSGAEPKDLLIPPIHVVHRRSTDVVAANDPQVSQAISFIRTNANTPISVGDVVASVPISRRSLYTRFRTETGQSIYEYVRSVRLELFAKMLLDTNLNVSEIAYSMGYDSDTNVSRLFRQVKGMTPLAYRKRYSRQ